MRSLDNPSDTSARGLVPTSERSREGPRAMMIALSAIAIIYSLGVVLIVARSGDIGTRCVIGTDLKEAVADDYAWQPERPNVGDVLTSIGEWKIANYTDYLDALRGIRGKAGIDVPVSWRTPEGRSKSATARVRYRPDRTYLWSILWFLQEMVIFALGARVYWKRPSDESARLFFRLCVVTVGAFMGGYHWAELVVEPLLVYSFVGFAVLVPAVSLHFGLVFPKPNSFFEARRAGTLRVIYGVAFANIAVLWLFMFIPRWMNRVAPGRVDVAALFETLKQVAYVSIGIAVVSFLLFCASLVKGYRSARSTSERNQVKWVLLATLFAIPLIVYMLYRATSNPSRLGLSSAAWPMYAVSLLYTLAFTLSITRYKLMQVDDFFNRGVIYVLVSVSAGLVYSAVLVVSTLIIGDRLLGQDQDAGRGGVVAGVTAIAILILSGAARDRFQKAIDRRFYREKYKFDQAMKKMGLAVGSLVDRETLGKRLLEAAAEVVRVDWGVIYLRDDERSPLDYVAHTGPTPDERLISADNPLVLHLEKNPSIRVPHSMALTRASDPATDAMISLGGEVAASLQNGGVLKGMIVLGPKRSELPYEDEEIAFLNALSSVATLALHSSGIQRTLEVLNQELRDKVEKIAEQQRRILILQDQLTGRGAPSSDSTEIPEGDAAERGVFERIKGSSITVRRMLDVARKVAASPSAVLIRGESGTGKELIAEAIHAAGPRAGRPFVKVHCAALSQGLLESELFGHVKGAFTGADRDRVGRFEQADGGTLFLDEIGDINLEVQTKLLRVLQETAFERVGSSQSIRVDVRILAATHQDLEALIRSGRFREDLYYRLNVISIRTPTLRERKEDVFELAIGFLTEQARRVGRPVTHIEDEALEVLTSYDWPGNIRQLENVIERAVVLADGPALTLDDLPAELRDGRASTKRARRSQLVTAGASISDPRPSIGFREPRDESDRDLEDFERARLLDALSEAEGNKSEAARLLGLPRSTFCSKLKKHGLL